VENRELLVIGSTSFRDVPLFRCVWVEGLRKESGRTYLLGVGGVMNLLKLKKIDSVAFSEYFINEQK